ncbi:hypothetical protein MD588_19030 [Photobacterium sp. SDRW27]|uniref:hypothetical protein n=1 Tax=Photobacterium obscurum TaxID=2829490 RepID=UPI002244D981|nr:hypothetical protein [Photobacterium obscurum]MCW8330891.1 hypothetical protein [Photobacterium obscurum]
MENQRHIVTSPIHRPCPDMAGCTNHNPELTKQSLKTVQRLRKKFGLKTTAERIERQREYLSELAMLMVGGVR